MPTQGRDRRGQVRDERGASAAESAIVATLLFMMLMAVVQTALVVHAQNVARAAAQEAVAGARQFDANEADGYARASEALDTLGSRMLTDRHVHVERIDGQVRASVTGQAISIVPLWSPRIEQTAAGAVEHFAPGPGP